MSEQEHNAEEMLDAQPLQQIPVVEASELEESDPEVSRFEDEGGSQWTT